MYKSKEVAEIIYRELEEIINDKMNNLMDFKDDDEWYDKKDEVTLELAKLIRPDLFTEK